ncbi:hypothetical protein HDV00_002696 [Rhizophlyctis rosea]|nr:hypothetical protein HDV00_002696 [Rhizophlyctis rosea]
MQSLLRSAFRVRCNCPQPTTIATSLPKVHPPRSPYRPFSNDASNTTTTNTTDNTTNLTSSHQHPSQPNNRFQENQDRLRDHTRQNDIRSHDPRMHQQQPITIDPRTLFIYKKRKAVAQTATGVAGLFAALAIFVQMKRTGNKMDDLVSEVRNLTGVLREMKVEVASVRGELRELKEEVRGLRGEVGEVQRQVRRGVGEVRNGVGELRSFGNEVRKEVKERRRRREGEREGKR